MRHLIKFNELKVSTYYSAADKLKEIGHLNRHDRLKDWADENETRKVFNRYKEVGYFNLDIMKLGYGSVGSNLLMNGNFLIVPSFDVSFNSDIYYCEKNSSDGFTFCFEFGVMPFDEKTKSEFIKLAETNKDISEYYQRSGIAWIDRILLDFIKPNEASPNPDGQYILSCVEGTIFKFHDRKESIRFKKLFVDSINNENDWGSDIHSKSLGYDFKDFFYDNTELDIKYYHKFLDVVKKMSVNKLYSN